MQQDNANFCEPYAIGQTRPLNDAYFVQIRLDCIEALVPYLSPCGLLGAAMSGIGIPRPRSRRLIYRSAINILGLPRSSMSKSYSIDQTLKSCRLVKVSFPIRQFKNLGWLPDAGG
jgi:hypothetical protein